MNIKTPFFFLFLMMIGTFSNCASNKKKAIQLKMMSYNIRHGEGLDKVLDLSRAASIIKSVNPDICGIQEVDDFCLRSGTISQTKFLAQFTKMVGTFGKFMDFQEGEYGMATLVGKPIISTKILDLPDAIYEPRSAIIHEIRLDDAFNIAFANVHFDWIEGEQGSNNRLRQSEVLLNYLDSLNLPIIITGDFNCTPQSPTMTYFADQGFKFVSKGTDNLSFQIEEKAEIDHLIYRNSDKVSFTTKNAFLIKEPIVSDHRPFVVELEIYYK